MLKKYQDIDDGVNVVAEKIVDSAFHVHKNLGPGYPERVYESAFCIELEKRGLNFERQKVIKVIYPPDIILDPEYRLDVVVEGCVIVELKCVESILPVHQAQLYSYMKMSDVGLGFLINFNVSLIKDGIKRQCIK